MKIAAEFPVLCFYLKELISKKAVAVFPWEETPEIKGSKVKSLLSTALNYLLAFKGKKTIEELLSTGSCIRLLHHYRKKLNRYIADIENTVNNILYRGYYTKRFVFFKISHRHIIEPFLCRKARWVYGMPVFVVSTRGLFATERVASIPAVNYMGCMYSRRKLSFKELCKLFGLL